MHLWDERLAPNLSGRTMGYDHHLSGEFNGIDAWKKDHTANLTEMVDVSKGYSLEVVNVVRGGESAWAAVETVTSGEAKSGISLSLSSYRIRIKTMFTNLVNREEMAPWACHARSIQS